MEEEDVVWLSELESEEPAFVVLDDEELFAELKAFLTVSINLLPALLELPFEVPLGPQSMPANTEPRKSEDFRLTSSTNELSKDARVLI